MSAVVRDARVVDSMRSWISDCWLGDEASELSEGVVVRIVAARYAGGVRGFLADELGL